MIETVGLEEMDTAVIPTASRPRESGTRSVGTVIVALCVLAATILGVQVFLSRVVSGVGRSTYGVAGNDRWLQADSSSSTGWFRMDPTLASQPSSAVLWVDATDQYQVWVNGKKLVDNRNASRAGLKPQAQAVDVANLLRSGRNVIAIQANSLAEGAPRMWSRLSVQMRTGPAVVFGTDSSLWRSTADTALVGAALGQQPRFIEPTFSLTRWGRPLLNAASRKAESTTPLAVLETPFTAVPLLPSRTTETDALFSTTLSLPTGTDDVWIRLAATGSATVLLNGDRIAVLPSPGYVSPTSHRTAPMMVLHVGSADRVGAGKLQIHTAGSRSVMVLDALARTDAGWQKLDTGISRWSVTSLTAPAFVGPATAGVLTSVWNHGFSREEFAASTAGTSYLRSAAIIAACLVALVLLMLVAVRLFGGQLAQWLWRVVVFAALPTAALTLMLATLSRWKVFADSFAVSKSWHYLLPAFFIALVAGCLLFGLALRLKPEIGGRTLAAEPSESSALTEGSAVSQSAGDSQRSWYTPDARKLGVIAIAAVGVFVMGWRLWRQPLWQDEATTIEVARSIKGHGLPRLASGLLYFKAEFFHALLAVLLSITPDVSVLRMLSLFWFGATILVFGLLLMPTLAPGRPGIQLLATAAMVVVPAEQVWARDVRMYQQMQFFSVLFVALFLRALLQKSPRYTAFSAIALLAMYLSHEESFVLLPAVVVVAALCWQQSWELRWTALRWYGPVAVVIGGQYLLSQIHPPDFGADLSNRPYVGWDPHQADFYYQRIFFAPLGNTGSLAVLSCLALIGLGVATAKREEGVKLVGWMVVVTTATTSLLFTAKVSRYSFIVMPMLIALAVMGGYYIVAWLARLTKAQVGEPATGHRLHKVGFVLTTCLLSVAVLSTLGVSPRDYGLLAADVTSAPNPYLHPDYQSSVDYLKANYRTGDVIITLSPPVMTSQYLGRSPDRIIQTGRNKLLYVIYKDGIATDTILGVPVILSGDDLRRYVEQHSRVWLVSDTGSLIQGVPTDLRDEVSAAFSVVYQNAGTSVSLRDAG